MPATSSTSSPRFVTSAAAPARPRTLERADRNPLALWHLLSLDAPTVATLWTIYAASLAHVSLPLSVPVAMFASVWILYAADRLLDSRMLATTAPSPVLSPISNDSRRTCGSAPDLEARHLFHHQHRRAMITGIVASALLLAAILPRLDPEAIRLDLVLGSLLIAYFVLIHATQSAHRLPKEISVGLFFSAAVFIPAVARAPQMRLTLLPVALLFAALCSLNCLFIYRWEHTAGHDSAGLLEPHWLTRNAIRHLHFIAFLLVLLSVAVALATGRAAFPPVALSALLLLGLDRLRQHMAPVTLRAAADLVLLTPLPLLLFHYAA